MNSINAEQELDEIIKMPDEEFFKAIYLGKVKELISQYIEDLNNEH